MLNYTITFCIPFFELSVLWFVYYLLLVFLKGTRAIQVLRGFVILVVVFFLAQRFELYTLDWILSRLLAVSVIAFLIIFQPELRRGLASIGQKPMFNILPAEAELVEELTNAVLTLSKKKIGALVAIE